MAAGGVHNCALVSGVAWCWCRNYYGQLGNEGEMDSPVPVRVQGFSVAVTAIVLGQDHTCALVNSGVQCWGANASGKLGNNTSVGSPVPVPVQLP